MTVYTLTRYVFLFSPVLIARISNIYPRLTYQDKTDDVLAGIRSTALLFGTYTRPILATLTLSSVSLISYAGYLNAHGFPYYLGVGVATAQLARVLYRTDFDSRPSCWSGFVGCGWAGFWIWMGALGDYAFLVSGL